MQGWRNNQEDAEILQIPLDDPHSSLFAVFDGHGSDLVSNFCSEQLGGVLTKNPNQLSGNQEQALSETFLKMDKIMLSNVGRRILFKNIMRKDQHQELSFPKNVDFDQQVTLSKEDPVDIAIMVEDKVLEKQKNLPEYFSHRDIMEEFTDIKTNDIDMIIKLSISFCGGCTANVGLLKNGKFYCANAGDSRGVAYKKDKTTYPLSFDHKPENPEEKQRIESAGGQVSDNRVNANLNLSRAFGDFTQKLNKQYADDKQLVIAVPEIRSVDFRDCEFVILACDGIQDCVSNEELTHWFANAIQQFKNKTFEQTPRVNREKGKEIVSEPVTDIKLEHLVQKFLDGICSNDTMTACGTDNMTCILILNNE